MERYKCKLSRKEFNRRRSGTTRYWFKSEGAVDYRPWGYVCRNKHLMRLRSAAGKFRTDNVSKRSLLRRCYSLTKENPSGSNSLPFSTNMISGPFMKDLLRSEHGLYESTGRVLNKGKQLNVRPSKATRYDSDNSSEENLSGCSQPGIRFPSSKSWSEIKIISALSFARE
jgi:hypothetical protein